MTLWETMTGSDLTRDWKALEARAAALPPDYQAAWAQVRAHLMPYSGFSGRNLMPLLDGVLGLLEETAADGQDVQQVLGDDIGGFCAAVAGGEGARTYRDRWRDQLNRSVARKLRQRGARRGHR
jgi:DNA-binding ferritin-like protein (Dps family)